jgi:methylase of polypeptide subunit release factors
MTRAPLARPFGELTIAYDHRVLEPRPWTVAQSRWVSDLLAEAPEGPVLEVCTGAGHIGLLAVHGHERDLVLVDLDEAACDFARANAESAGMGDRVTVRCGRMDEVVSNDEWYAAIVADPPWVSTSDLARYPDDPRLAIDGGESGLDLVWACVDVITRHLADGGFAVLQVGPGSQADAVEQHVHRHRELNLRYEGRQVHDRGVLVHLSRPA